MTNEQGKYYLFENYKQSSKRYKYFAQQVIITLRNIHVGIYIKDFLLMTR